MEEGKERKEGSKMDISTITDIISQVGFPIFLCIYFIYYNVQVIEKLKEVIQENNAKTDEVIVELTLTIQKLIDRLDKGGNTDEV